MQRLKYSVIQRRVHRISTSNVGKLHGARIILLLYRDPKRR